MTNVHFAPVGRRAPTMSLRGGGGARGEVKILLRCPPGAVYNVMLYTRLFQPVWRALLERACTHSEPRSHVCYTNKACYVQNVYKYFIRKYARL